MGLAVLYGGRDGADGIPLDEIRSINEERGETKTW